MTNRVWLAPQASHNNHDIETYVIPRKDVMTPKSVPDAIKA